RADDIAFRADAKQLALHRVEMIARIELLSEDFIQRTSEDHSRCLAIRGDVFVTIGNPDIGDAGRAQLAAEALTDLAASDAVIHPEAPHALVAAAQRETISRPGMREEGAVEIEAETLRPRPINPAGEVFGRELIAFDRPD